MITLLNVGFSCWVNAFTFVADGRSLVTESVFSEEAALVVVESRSVDLEQPKGITHKKKKILFRFGVQIKKWRLVRPALLNLHTRLEPGF